ncbi:MAG: S9 family peptidase [Terriglobales bacterium]
MYKPLGLFFLATTLGLSQTPKLSTCLTNASMRTYQTVSDPQLSPDGTKVVWVQHDSTAAGAATHLWIAPTSGATPARQITESPASDKDGESAPQWMPDGSALLFLAKRGKVKQIFRLPVAGGEAAPFTLKAGKLALSPNRFAISPNGQWLVFLARQPQTAEEKQNKTDKKDAVVVGQDKNPNRIWLYSLTQNTRGPAPVNVVPLTPLSREAHAFAWSPDSSRVAVITGALGNADERGPNARLTIAAVDKPEQRRVLPTVPASISAAAFSPDGHTLAFLAQSQHDLPPGVRDLYVMSLSGGTPRDLSAAGPYTIGGGLTWRSDSSAIYVSAQRRTRSTLLAFPVRGSLPSWQPAATPIATSFATNRQQSGWAFISDSTNRLPQVAFAARPNGPITVLSDANAQWPASGWRVARAVSWPAAGGMTIHGLYFPPASCPGAAPLRAGKSPMILIAHGGPTGAFLQTFNPFVQWLTAQGWAVLEVNPRGSTGYGWQFTAADRNDLGGQDYADEMAGLDWALAHEPVDARRLGMFGYSYGGEMAGFIAGKTTRFAAIVAGAPVIDQYSEYGTEHGSWYDRWFFGRPWRRPQDAWRQSPLASAKNAHTPMLLLQGQADTTDPLGQSEEEYRALRQDGVPVRLVTFPRDNHGPLAENIFAAPSHEPWHGFEGRAQILAWYQKYFRQALHP